MLVWFSEVSTHTHQKPIENILTTEPRENGCCISVRNVTYELLESVVSGVSCCPSRRILDVCS